MPVGKRSPGRLDHLERAGDAGAVAGLQARGGFRIAPRKLRVQRLDAIALQPRPYHIADLVRDRRHRRQASRERLEIESGAADEDRQPPFTAHLRKHGRRVSDVTARRVVHGRIDMAIKPVRQPRLFRQCRPRGDDAQVAIDLHGIGIDDGAAGLFRQPQREGRLAAGGRPCDKHRLVVRQRNHPRKP